MYLVLHLYFDKKLFQRAIKDKATRVKDKEDVNNLEVGFTVDYDKLRNTLIEKLFSLINGKTSQGVLNDLGEEILPKGKKFTLKMLNSVADFEHLTKGIWTTDKDLNNLVNRLIHNYKIKVNDLQGSLRRKKFAVTVGDELPKGIIKLAKVYIAIDN